MSGMSSPLQLSQLPSHATSRISVGSFSARRRSTLFLIAAAGTLACVYAIQIDFNGLNGSPVRSPGFRSRVQSGIAGLGGVWTPRFARPERCTTPRLMRVSAEVDKIRFEVNKLRARQIKAELTELGIDTSTVVEKEELVRMLANERHSRSGLNGFKRQAHQILGKAKDGMNEKALGALNAVQEFNIKREIEKQASDIKNKINQNVEWFDHENPNPFTDTPIIRKQRGYYKGGDKI
ncbi:hypothetical protein AAMO2058_001686000 [Amorphochlora amoebiformis]